MAARDSAVFQSRRLDAAVSDWVLQPNPGRTECLPLPNTEPCWWLILTLRGLVRWGGFEQVLNGITVFPLPDSAVTAESPPADAGTCVNVLSRLEPKPLWPDGDKAPDSWQKNPNHGQKGWQMFSRKQDVCQAVCVSWCFWPKPWVCLFRDRLRRWISCLCFYTVENKPSETNGLKLCLWVCPTFSTTPHPTDQTGAEPL